MSLSFVSRRHMGAGQRRRKRMAWGLGDHWRGNTVAISAREAFGDTWARLADEAGLAPDGWHATPVSRRDDPARARAVWRVTRGAEVLALKQVRRPRDEAAFLSDIAAQLDASRRFAGFPEILAVDSAAQSVLMTFADGATLYDALAAPDADHGAILAAAGRWVAALHRAGFDERRNFQPKYSVRHLGRLFDEVRSAARAAPPRSVVWCDAVAALCAMAPDFERRETVSALGHGDLNLRNLLVADTGVTGLDPRSVTAVPVGHDIARLAVHYGALIAPPDAAPDPATGALPGVDLSGFFRGYDLVGPDDPSVGFLCRMRVLIDWQTLPAEALQTGAEQRRFRGLVRLAEAAFGTGP
ncbi:phosphotransferase family protein [Roseivivax sp. CAU 1753]